MKQQKLLADLAKACELLKNIQRQMPEKSRFSNKVREAERLVDRAIDNIKKNEKVVEKTDLLEITQLLSSVLNLLSWIKDLFISWMYHTLRCLHEYRNYEEENWQAHQDDQSWCWC